MSDQIEGRRPVLEALRAGRRITEILIARGVRDGGALAEIRREARRAGVPIRELARRDLEGRTHTRAPQGVVARVPPFAYADLETILDRARTSDRPALVVALDGVTDPHNVGALARSAEGAGAHGLVLPKRRAAPVTAAVEKAAAGALGYLPVAQVPNLARALELLREAGLWTVVLDGDATASMYELPVAGEPLCLVVGSEGRGVSRLVAERADHRCRIPLHGRVASLNASVAGAVALFEVARRRGGDSSGIRPGD